jgi:hypothetical protein
MRQPSCAAGGSGPGEECYNRTLEMSGFGTFGMALKLGELAPQLHGTKDDFNNNE